MATVILACTALLACGEQQETPESLATPASAPEPGVTVNRIAFVSTSGELFTMNPDGGDLRSLTGQFQQASSGPSGLLAQPLDQEYFFTWPTWSPDGTEISASRVGTSGGQNTLSIVVIDTKTNRFTTPFENSAMQLVARTAPHYMYWSPNSRRLAFLASTEDGLALFVKDTQSEDAPVQVVTEPPMYFHWAADSGSLLIHHGEDVKVAKVPFDLPPQTLFTSPLSFRTPGVSPDGARFAYVREAETGSSLVVAPTDDPENGESLLAVEDFAALAWSPTGEEIAVVDQLNQATTVYQRIRVVPADGGEARTVVEGNILAFFWSPTGQTIAWVGVDFDQGRFEWMTTDQFGGASKLLMRFQPSGAEFTMLSFFDQFAYSNSPWSPDGARLVFAGTRDASSGQQNGQAPSGDRIFVLDADGSNAPRDLSGGSLAFWSWN